MILVLHQLFGLCYLCILSLFDQDGTLLVNMLGLTKIKVQQKVNTSINYSPVVLHLDRDVGPRLSFFFRAHLI